jgi:hypothetical protein
MANVSKMNKKQLIAHGKKLGIKLDDGMVKKTMVLLIKNPPSKPTKIVGKPVTQSKVKTITTPQPKGFWQSIKDFFRV